MIKGNKNEMLVDEDGDYIFMLCPMKLRSKDDHDCEGTKCMAWRWYEPSGPEMRRGYCGLAGRPGHEE